MNPLLAAVIYICGIAGLFYLDRDRTVRISKALWLPVLYFCIIGSRPVSSWLGLSPTGTNVQLEGSPFDAAIFGILECASIAALVQRRNKVLRLLAANWPIVLYFFYCLISVTWSSHPEVSLKRWFKSLSDITMVLIVITDARPFTAFRKLICRVGFVLLPTSLLLIKYFEHLGRAYSPIGEIENTGVTTNKNILGVVLLVITLGTLWHVMALVRDKACANRRRHLVAHCVLLAFGIWLLLTAHSATSMACFCLGAGLMLATNHKWIKRRPSRVQWLCLVLVVGGALTFFFSGQTGVASALGRSATLSGRTDIWAALLPTVPNPIVGAGYESYWIGPGAETLWRTLGQAGWWHPEILVTEAHDGYIEMYLNLGWIGVLLISTVLITGYRRAVAAFKKEPSVGCLMLAYVMVSAVYSITEAGFRSPDPMWIFLLWAIVSSSGLTMGIACESKEPRRTIRKNPSPIAAEQVSWA